MVNKSRATMARQRHAARQQAYRRRKAMERASVGPAAAPTIVEGDAVGDFLSSVIVWARVDRSAQAGRHAASAAKLIAERTFEPASMARGMARIMGLQPAEASADSLIREIAGERLALAAKAISSGSAKAADVKAGIDAARTLIEHRPKYDDERAGLFYAVVASGSRLGKAGIPAHLLIDDEPAIVDDLDDDEAVYTAEGQPIE